jgi:hypothetical protein
MNLLNISPLHLSRDVAKEVARGFELRNDADCFEALWEVANEARAVRKENLKSGELDREIAAGAAAGGVTLVGALMAGGCFVIGCCGSPMLAVYVSLFGAKALGLGKPLMALVTLISISCSYWCLSRRLARGTTCMDDCC